MAKIPNRNEKRLAVKLKMSKKTLKTIAKKTKKNQGEAMEVDDPKISIDRLPQSSEVSEKRETKVNENRLRANDCPLFLNPKAKNLKNVKTDRLSQTVVVPTRRVSKKRIRKLLKAKQRDDRAKERASKTMEVN
ncbi:hypothetical protein FO519_006030 [Halicephalobus sp. NKZ332]|nr:hypothetical protein FO519_006030 [Halicephalobus sp. NKZ332]